MGMITTIGLDIAKSVFQVHGIDADGDVMVRRKLARSRVLTFFEKLPRCLVGIEACNTSHYWARELIALGHDVRLMPAQYVKAYVKRGKNDAADAEAICEAVTRPTMRFVAVKTPEQRSVMMLHRVRLMLNRQRTQLSNSIRAHMSEFGAVASVGRMGLERLLAVVADQGDPRIPADARICLQMLIAQLSVVKEQILENDRRLRESARKTEVGRRLMEIRASARCSRAHSSRVLPILLSLRPAATSPCGLVSCRSRTRVAVRSGSEASPGQVMVTCGRCWWSAPWRASGMASGMAPSAPGSSSSLPGALQRSLLSRWQTRPRGWSGR